MSQIAPSLHEPVEATARKRLTPAQRVEILARQNDLCPYCDMSLIWVMIGSVSEPAKETKVYGPMIDEHIIPLDLGGSNDLSNRALLCVDCAKAKTRLDAKDIAKSRRLRNKPLAKPKRPIRSRGFNKHLRRKFNGQVEQRP